MEPTHKTLNDALKAIDYTKGTIPALFGTYDVTDFQKVNSVNIAFMKYVTESLDGGSDRLKSETFPEAFIYKNIHQDWPFVIFMDSGEIKRLPYFEEQVNIVLVNQAKSDYALFGRNVVENIMAAYYQKEECGCNCALSSYLLHNTDVGSLKIQVVAGDISGDLDSFITPCIAACVSNIVETKHDSPWLNKLRPRSLWYDYPAMQYVLGMDYLCDLAVAVLAARDNKIKELIVSLEFPWGERDTEGFCGTFTPRERTDSTKLREMYFRFLNNPVHIVSKDVC